jgi:hypothetical protein
VSDQDFFFDEDESEQKSPAKSQAKKSAPRKPAQSRGSRPASSGSVMQQNVSMTVTALVSVVTLLVGVIVGIALPVGENDVPEPTVGADTFSGTAPELSPEELGSGELPEGHPDIGAMPGGVPTDTVEETATP